MSVSMIRFSTPCLVRCWGVRCFAFQIKNTVRPTSNSSSKTNDLKEYMLCVFLRTFAHKTSAQPPSPRKVLNLNSNNNTPRPTSNKFPDDDIVVQSDVTNASNSYRKRMEKEFLFRPENQHLNSARTLAIKIRRDLKKRSFIAFKKNKTHDSKTETATVDQIQTNGNYGDLIAIDKPYGLPSHGGPGVVHSVNSLLPLLAKKLNHRMRNSIPNPTLYPVHRLDKETTGVILLAKTQEAAQHLHSMFVRHCVIKKYWLITVGVPDPSEGMIDIPMVETGVPGRYRMGIRPDIAAVFKNFGRTGSVRGTVAITNFRVISENGNAALVEVHPQTGVKHQLRVHMSLGMGCPLLGDHKYSNNKLAPQRLPMDMLQCLGISQAKVRTVPMHLHARELTLPDFMDGRNLCISTRVPEFFEQNMKRLSLKVP